MIKISLIVPTFNRSKFLVKALSSFLSQTLPPQDYEIIIVDNNSKEDTKEIVGNVMKSAKCSWSYLFEPRQGLHFARNTGIVQARGDIVVFGDDDIIANEKWLERLKDEFDHHPTTGVAGGKIIPKWETEPDQWIYDYGTDKTHAVFAYLDYGDKRLVLNHEYVMGCNFAIRRNLALQIGGSPPDTFPKELKHLSGTGENAMIDEVRKVNFQSIYIPDALVYHHVDSTRITLDYFIERHQRWAIEDVFDRFRKKSKIHAAKELLDLSFEKLTKSPIDSQSKIKPDYFQMIQKEYSYELILQTIRVLTDPLLLDHITRKSYFS